VRVGAISVIVSCFSGWFCTAYGPAGNNPRLVCRQGPACFESGLAMQFPLLPGEPGRRECYETGFPAARRRTATKVAAASAMTTAPYAYVVSLSP
jgi:hypothetical protein